MQQGWRKRYWLYGLLGLAVAQVAPADAQASGRGGEVFDRSGTSFARRKPAWSWRHRVNGLGHKFDRRDPRAPGGGGTSGPVQGGGDPEAPEPTAALLFGLGALAVQRAARKGPAR